MTTGDGDAVYFSTPEGKFEAAMKKHYDLNDARDSLVHPSVEVKKIMATKLTKTRRDLGDARDNLEF